MNRQNGLVKAIGSQDLEERTFERPGQLSITRRRWAVLIIREFLAQLMEKDHESKTEIADALGINSRQLKFYLDFLLDRGFVTAQCNGSTRSTAIKLTEKGRGLATLIDSLMSELDLSGDIENRAVFR